MGNLHKLSFFILLHHLVSCEVIRIYAHLLYEEVWHNNCCSPYNDNGPVERRAQNIRESNLVHHCTRRILIEKDRDWHEAKEREDVSQHNEVGVVLCADEDYNVVHKYQDGETCKSCCPDAVCFTIFVGYTTKIAVCQERDIKDNDTREPCEQNPLEEFTD